MFTNNLEAIDRMDYVHLGRLVVITLLQGGAGLPLLTPPLAEYILMGRINCLTPEDFPPKKRCLIKQVLILLIWLQIVVNKLGNCSSMNRWWR